MEDKQQLVVDLNKLYLGIEEYEQFIEGQKYNIKSFSLYTLTGKLGLEGNERLFLTNMETADDMVIDQDGNIVRYNSKTRDILSVTGIKCFKDTVDILLKDTSHFVKNMEGGEEGVSFFEQVKKHMDYCNKKKQPSFASLECFMDIITAVPNMYVLCYGNPLTGESQLKCINDFQKGR